MARSPLCPYTCGICQKPCEAAKGTALQLLQLCAGCQEKRYAKGLADQWRVAGETSKAPPAAPTFEQVWGANG